MYKASLFRLVVDNRDKSAIRFHTIQERCNHLRRKEEILFAKEIRFAVDALEFLHER